MILTGQWPDVYGNLMVDWGEEYETYTPVGMQLLKYRATTKKTQKASSASFFGLAPDKAEGGPFAEEDQQQGYAIIWTQAAIGTGITLTHEDFLFDQTMDMAEKVRGLAQSVQMRREHDIGMRFKNADQTSFTNVSGNSVDLKTADTKALLDSAHPIPNSSTTMSNKVADSNGNYLPFNKTNALVALNKFRTFSNEKGLKINGLRPTHIVTSDNELMKEAVDRVFTSPNEPESGNRGVNTLARMGIQHIQLPSLQQDNTGAFDSTGQYYWFIICQPQSDYYMMEAEAPTPVFPKVDMSDPNLPITGDLKVTVRGTYALFIRRFHWCVGSLASRLG